MIGVTRCDLGIQCGLVQIVDHVFHFLLVELDLGGTASYNRDHLLHFFFAGEVMSDVEHHIARADDRAAPPKQECFWLKGGRLL
jgi:hypothetical protein